MSRPFTSESFWSRVKPDNEGCWIWTGCKNRDGYGKVMVYQKVKMAHRVAFELNNGIHPGDRKVLHKCDNPPCVNPSHLFLGTDRDNAIDAARKGRRHQKLTIQQVQEIRSIWSSGSVTQLHIAELFGVQRNTISRIVNYVRRVYA